MKRHGHLFESVANFAALLAAERRARRGKRNRPDVARFVFHLETNLLELESELRARTYAMRPYRTFLVREPKLRRICAADYRDRVVHHAVCDVLDPLFDGGLIADTFACRRGKGVHACVRRVQDLARKYPYALLCDVKRYFETIDHGVLKRLYRRKLKDRALLALLDRIVDHPLPGCAPGKGVPIGNLTSQYFANLYLGELDHLIKDELRLPGYVRYMDDMVLLADSKARLRETLSTITEFLETRLRLELRPERTRLLPVTQGLPWLGFRAFPGVLRLDGRKWARMRRRIRAREAAFAQGLIGEEELARSVSSMVAHVSHIDSLQARQRLFELSW